MHTLPVTTARREQLVEQLRGFRHGEGNATAHVKSSLMGAHVSVPIVEGRLALGTWQAVYFCEFDGPRQRQVWITCTSSILNA